LNARLFHNRRLPWIATTDNADKGRQEALESAGAVIIRFPRDAENRVDLNSVLRWLADKGINSVMVEGVGTRYTSFLSSSGGPDCADYSSVFIGGLHGVEDALARTGKETIVLSLFPN
jgi:riboflavin biosynthesis pyrimidine reductase